MRNSHILNIAYIQYMQKWNKESGIKNVDIRVREEVQKSWI